VLAVLAVLAVLTALTALTALTVLTVYHWFLLVACYSLLMSGCRFFSAPRLSNGSSTWQTYPLLSATRSFKDWANK
ncbi:MAG: hypothetical protein VW349_13720, partial [Gammaproteobacteria bacterium]